MVPAPTPSLGFHLKTTVQSAGVAPHQVRVTFGAQAPVSPFQEFPKGGHGALHPLKMALDCVSLFQGARGLLRHQGQRCDLLAGDLPVIFEFLVSLFLDLSPFDFFAAFTQTVTSPSTNSNAPSTSLHASHGRCSGLFPYARSSQISVAESY